MSGLFSLSRSDFTSWISPYSCPRRNVFGHNGSRANLGVISYPDAANNDGVCTNYDAVTDDRTWSVVMLIANDDSISQGNPGTYPRVVIYDQAKAVEDRQTRSNDCLRSQFNTQEKLGNESV